jgi:hypothetical protein
MLKPNASDEVYRERLLRNSDAACNAPIVKHAGWSSVDSCRSGEALYSSGRKEAQRGMLKERNFRLKLS